MFDKEGNGLVTVDTLQHVMLNLGEKLTPEETADMMKTAEVDNDGNINYISKWPWTLLIIVNAEMYCMAHS